MKKSYDAFITNNGLGYVGNQEECQYSFVATPTISEILNGHTGGVIRFKIKVTHFAFYNVGLALDENVLNSDLPHMKKGCYFM